MTSCYCFVFLIIALLTHTLRANDDCDGARVVTSFPFQENGDTTDATVDFPDATETLYNNVSLTCGIKESARGIWYRIPGNNRFLQASVTDIDNVRFKTAIFQGSCDDLECLRPSSSYKYETERTQPTSTWFAENGKTYYLHVTGLSDSDVGEFALQISKMSYKPLENDSCDSPSQVDAVDETVNAINFDGARPQRLDVPDCGFHSFSRGMFFSFTGTGYAQNITLTVKGGDNLELSVLSSECGECIYHTNFLTKDDSPYTLEFKSQIGKEYIAVVAGDSFEDTGPFTLQFDSKKPIETPSSGITSGSVTAILFVIAITIFMS